MITSSGRSQSSRSNDSTSCNWAVGLPEPLVRAWHTAAKMSSPQTCLVLTILVCDGWVLLEHGGGGIVSVRAFGWLSNSSMARGGLAREVFGDTIAGRWLLPSGCGKVVKRSTGGGRGSFGMGLRGMQDLPKPNLLLQLLQNPLRFTSVFKLASNALLTFQTPHAPLAIDAP